MQALGDDLIERRVLLAAQQVELGRDLAQGALEARDDGRDRHEPVLGMARYEKKAAPPLKELALQGLALLFDDEP